VPGEGDRKHCLHLTTPTAVMAGLDPATQPTSPQSPPRPLHATLGGRVKPGHDADTVV